jgi:hypothetical protein
MGEAQRRQLALQTQALEAMAVDTPVGRIHVQWDHTARATSNALLNDGLTMCVLQLARLRHAARELVDRRP